MKIQTVILSIALGALASNIGCGPKKPTLPQDGEDVNPRQAFITGVQILDKPDRQGNVDYASAYAHFAAAARVKPEMASAQFNAGYTAEKLGNLLQAEEHFRMTLQADKSHKQALFALADVLARQDQGSEAVDIYKVYIENNPEDIEARAGYTEVLIAAEMYEDAFLQAQEALRRDTEDLEAYRNLSRMYFAQGDFAMSQLCADKARSLSEEDAGIYNNQGVTFLEMNDEPRAIAEFLRAREIDPSHLEANMNLGWLALKSGDYGLALDCFQQATKAAPGNLDAKLGLAVALRGTNDIHGAAKIYDSIIEADSKNRIAYLNAATLQEMYAKNYNKALKYHDAYVSNVLGGQPDLESQQLEARIKDSKAEEERREAEAEAKRKAEEERLARQQQALTDLKTQMSTLESLLAQYGTCQIVVDEGHAEMGMMVIEQGGMIVEAEDHEMASEVLPFLQDTVAGIQAVTADCASEPAPSPDEGTAPPEEGTEEAPMEEEPPPVEEGE